MDMPGPTPPSAVDWNHFFNVAGYTAVIAVAITIGAMILFTIIYADKKGKPKFNPEKGLHKSRARDMSIFSAISIAILLILSILSFTLTPNARFVQASSLEVKVTAYQWGFRFIYPNGVTTTTDLNVPENVTVLFNVTSTDVYHNFYLPDFRVSIDAIPGRYNPIWVPMPTLIGQQQATYQILCKELCGVGHTFMFARLNVMPTFTFNQWLSNQTIPSGG